MPALISTVRYVDLGSYFYLLVIFLRYLAETFSAWIFLRLS